MRCSKGRTGSPIIYWAPVDGRRYPGVPPLFLELNRFDVADPGTPGLRFLRDALLIVEKAHYDHRVITLGVQVNDIGVGLAVLVSVQSFGPRHFGVIS